MVVAQFQPQRQISIPENTPKFCTWELALAGISLGLEHF
jgi:hypothetical protein